MIRKILYFIIQLNLRIFANCFIFIFDKIYKPLGNFKLPEITFTKINKNQILTYIYSVYLTYKIIFISYLLIFIRYFNIDTTIGTTIFRIIEYITLTGLEILDTLSQIIPLPSISFQLKVKIVVISATIIWIIAFCYRSLIDTLTSYQDLVDKKRGIDLQYLKNLPDYVVYTIEWYDDILMNIFARLLIILNIYILFKIDAFFKLILNPFLIIFHDLNYIYQRIRSLLEFLIIFKFLFYNLKSIIYLKIFYFYYFITRSFNWTFYHILTINFNLIINFIDKFINASLLIYLDFEQFIYYYFPIPFTFFIIFLFFYSLYYFFTFFLDYIIFFIFKKKKKLYNFYFLIYFSFYYFSFPKYLKIFFLKNFIIFTKYNLIRINLKILNYILKKKFLIFYLFPYDLQYKLNLIKLKKYHNILNTIWDIYYRVYYFKMTELQVIIIEFYRKITLKILGFNPMNIIHIPPKYRIILFQNIYLTLAKFLYFKKLNLFIYFRNFQLYLYNKINFINFSNYTILNIIQKIKEINYNFFIYKLFYTSYFFDKFYKMETHYYSYVYLFNYYINKKKIKYLKILNIFSFFCLFSFLFLYFYYFLTFTFKCIYIYYIIKLSFNKYYLIKLFNILLIIIYYYFINTL